MLHDMIVRLVAEGVLEHRLTEYDNEYRWNASYKGTWEMTVKERMRQS